MHSHSVLISPFRQNWAQEYYPNVYFTGKYIGYSDIKLQFLSKYVEVAAQSINSPKSPWLLANKSTHKAASESIQTPSFLHNLLCCRIYLKRIKLSFCPSIYTQ